MVTSSARSGLVGDQQARLAGERHSDHHPLAHAAGELVRILLQQPLGFGNVHETQHLDRAFPRLPRAHAEVKHQGPR